jgi:hypothetical protein
MRRAQLAAAFESWSLAEPSLAAQDDCELIDDKLLIEEEMGEEGAEENSFISILQKKLAATIEATKELGLKGAKLSLLI